ncbi:hypothetical protein M9Y10_030443 [Tritrichomonas musculus]|uniref:BZIP domain-containing protein n=1 Tax=Tritrichomonas musculus TaxID=1915356 RepID=A0ABR2H3A3_9EUKA
MSKNNIDTELFNETEVIKLLKSKQADSDSETLLNEVTTPQKSTRGRKRKYQSDEERILARRAQQKAYRERKKKELLELRALKASLESTPNN